MQHYLLHIGRSAEIGLGARAMSMVTATIRTAPDEAAVWTTATLGRHRVLAGRVQIDRGGARWIPLPAPLPMASTGAAEPVLRRAPGHGRLAVLGPQEAELLEALVETEDPELTELRAEFRGELVQRAETLANLVDSSRSHPATLPAIWALAHQVKGAAGSYGYPEISRRAAELEHAPEAAVPAAARRLIDSIRAAAPPDPPVVAPVEAFGGPQRRAAGGGPGGILIVEDDRFVAAMVAHRLERLGHRVTVAADGALGLEACRDSTPELVVLDLSMPRMGGFELLETLRRLPATARVPVLILTASGGDKDLVRAFALGADDFVSKPFSPDELVARIGRLLARTPAAAR